MKILLIDLDSKIPNLALMKISSYYKSNDYEVGFNITDLYRVNLLRKHLTNAFVMQYKRDKNTKKIAHMVNRKWIYWANEEIKI